MGTKGDFIAVTHFINPHLFWYHKVVVRSESALRIEALENQLAHACQPIPDWGIYAAKIGELVAARYLPWDKYIRGKVLTIDNSASGCTITMNGLEYIIWAIDHGFPVKICGKYLRKLPKTEYFQLPIEHVYRGGIASIVPAEEEFDFMARGEVMIIKPMWSDRACERIEKKIENAVYISFVKHFKDDKDDGHVWGDLMIVNRKQNNCKVADVLKGMKCAVDCSTNFRVECRLLKTTKIAQYFKNNGSINVRFNVFVTTHTSSKRAENEMEAILERGGEANVAKECKYANEKVKDWCERNTRLLELNDNDAGAAVDVVTDDANENITSLERTFTISSVHEYELSVDAKLVLDTSLDFCTLRNRNAASTVSAQSIDNVNKVASARSTNSGKSVSSHMRKLIEIGQKQKFEKKNIDCAASDNDNIEKRQNEYENVAAVNDEKEDISVISPSCSSAAPMNKSECDAGQSLSDFYRVYVQSSDSPNSFMTNKEQPNMAFLNKLPNNHNSRSISDKRVERLIAKRKAFGETQEIVPDSNNVKVQTKLELAVEAKMIPAGFDMMNLGKYNDNENHWHVKKTMRNENLHNDSSASFFGELKELDLENSNNVENQNFRHTRSHTDKYKNSTNTTKHLLDESVSELNDTILEPIKLPTISASNNVEPVVLPKRKQRELKSPAIQKDKIQEILQCAQYEKDSGNTFILDLNNLNKMNNSGAKSESELNGDATTPFDLSESSNSDSANRQKSSNKHALIKKRLELDNTSKEDNKEIFPILSRVEPNFSNAIYTQKSIKVDGIDGLNSLKLNAFDNKVLAHCRDSLTVDVIENFNDLIFPQQEITDIMTYMHITKVYRIQAYGWPHLLRSNSLFVVNPARSGKTWCYLPCICSLVCMRIQNFRVPETYGPVAIIMVPSSTHAEHVSKHCQRLLVKCDVKTVTLFGIRNMVDAKSALLEGCGILVTTPASLLRLLAEQDEFIDGSRLHHLVLDNVELMLSRSSQDFGAAVEAILKLSKRCKKQMLQMVATSREWKPELLYLINKSNQPLLLIGDFLEAAAYSKASITIKLGSSDKMSTILKFIEKHPSEINRLIIFCNDSTDASTVQQALVSSGHDCIACSKTSNATELHFIKDRSKHWPQGLIIVCEDDVFPELNIQSANNLIHYTMPATWTSFSNRFSAMAKSYLNVLKPNVIEIDNAPKPISLILLDKDNSEQLPSLHNFLKKHNQLKHVQPEVLTVIENVRKKREEVRTNNNLRLCPYLLEFCDCDEVRCYHRHILTRFDAISDNIPQCGELRVLILKVFSPTYYAVRLLKFKSNHSTEWREIRSSNEVPVFAMKLNLYYKKQESLVQHWPIYVNDLCISKVDDRFHRAQVLELGEIKTFNVIHRVQVTVKFIDLGEIKQIYSDELYDCDEQFRSFPAQAIDVRLKGVVPVDNERTWDSVATKSVQTWIKQDIDKNMCVQIKIDFVFAQTIFVNNVIVVKHLPSLRQYIYHVNLRRSLLKKKFAVKTQNNDNHKEKFGLLDMNSNKSDETNSTLSSDLEYKSYNNVSKYLTFSNDSDSNNTTAISNLQPKNNVKKETPPNLAIQSPLANALGDDWDCLPEQPAENEIYLPLLKNMPEQKKISPNNSSISGNSNLPMVKNMTDHKIISRKDSISGDSNSSSRGSIDSAREQWLQLPLHEIVKVEIGDEAENGKWSDIYLQCIDGVHQNNFNNLQELIRQHIDKMQNLSEKPFDKIQLRPMENCIVKYDGRYLRAKIFAIFSDEKTESIYRFFLCDYAVFVTAREAELFNDFLYPTTKKIVQFTPYQAVHCHLAGINLDIFARQQKVTKDFLFAYAVAESAKQPTKLTNFDVKSYDILFYQCDKEDDLESCEMVNKLLVDSNCAAPDPETKHFLDFDINVDLSGFENAEMVLETPMDDNNIANFNMVLQCLKQSSDMDINELGKYGDKMYKALKEGKEIYTTALKNQNNSLNNCGSEKHNKKNIDDEKNKEITKAKKTATMTEKIRDENVKTCESAIDAFPQTRPLHKRPKITWYQTDCVIYFVIFAPDITNDDYYLKVTSDTLYYAATVKHEEQAVILNLLGTVQPSEVTHEIRGFNVIVRLVKSFAMKWPRLLQQSDKYSTWLKYDLNTIEKTEMDYLLPQQAQLMEIGNIKSATKDTYPTLPERGDSDDEMELVNYTPIVNNDDARDPITEDI